MTYARLDRCAGPPCPNCGCEDAEILEQPKPAADKSWWRSGRAVCLHCLSEFRFKGGPEVESWMQQPQIDHQEPIVETRGPNDDGLAVPYVKMSCPACNSDAVRVTSTRRPIRQHKCSDCGHTFQSREKTA